MLSGRRFAPSGRLTLFAALFLPILIALGTWQVDRGRDKARLEASIEARAAEPARSLAPSALTAAAPHAPVAVTGRYRADRPVLLDNRTHAGRAGYELLVPLEPLASADGPGVLVNLGWLPAPRERSTLPTPELPAGPVSVRGTVVRPDPDVPVFGDVAEAGWPRRVQRVEPAAIAEAAGLALVDVVLVAAPGAPGGQTHVHDPVRMASTTHYGYAAQWYGLALVLGLGWLVASLPKRAAPDDDGPTDTR